MKNTASKGEAARLIRTALKDGWKREVSTNLDSKNVPWGVMVCLTKSTYFPNGYLNLSSQIIFSFRKTSKRGWVVAIAVPNGRKTFRGYWNAGYALRQMRETVARQQSIVTELATA
jgi:hypothetical protein